MRPERAHRTFDGRSTASIIDSTVRSLFVPTGICKDISKHKRRAHWYILFPTVWHHVRWKPQSPPHDPPTPAGRKMPHVPASLHVTAVSRLRVRWTPAGARRRQWSGVAAAQLSLRLVWAAPVSLGLNFFLLDGSDEGGRRDPAAGQRTCVRVAALFPFCLVGPSGSPGYELRPFALFPGVSSSDERLRLSTMVRSCLR